MNLLNIDFEFLLSASFWTTLTIGIAVLYCIVSIIFEAAEIVFLFTPSEKDDAWLNKQRKRWDVVKPFLKWFTVKTPLVLLLNKILVKLETIKAFIKSRKENKIKTKVN